MAAMPSLLLASEMDSVVTGSVSATTSTHLFRLEQESNSIHSKPPINAKLFREYLQWIRNTSTEWGASVMADHFYVFTMNHDVKDIVTEVRI